jgi:membrane protease YdiL (CAAX protease family)
VKEVNVSALNNQQFFFIAAVAAVGLGYLYMKRKAIGEAVNPVSPNNLAYKATNGVGAAVSGDEHFSLGVWLWELTNPQAVEREKELFN